MSQLVVRNIEPQLVLALKQRAAKLGHSAEEEHRRILEEALKAPKRRSFADFLISMPDVGMDQDFQRDAPAQLVTPRRARKSSVKSASPPTTKARSSKTGKAV